MHFHQVKLLTYGLFLTNYYGIKLGKVLDSIGKKRLRLEYSQKILAKLNIKINIENPEKLPDNGQYLILSNHRSIIDPLVIDIALKNTNIFGFWVSKKELYNSLFFGNAVRNGGAIRIDRKDSKMGTFFSDVKKALNDGNSICIFPEGTRNKTPQELLEFKDGFRFIALKNRISILPVYIQTNTDSALKQGLHNNDKEQEITIVIGEILDHRDKNDLETTYRAMFGLGI
ncbi:MAG TPA: lysophospholipid acyltransferase family protein [Sulfurovum sp.]|uniref:lysophospholipid acyltransferase family protein n=1 Tax=Sulfurovum sp. TaxID=1969726 RepID=UPI002F93DCE2